MILHVAYMVVGLALLAAGAEGLVRGATGLALRLGISALTIGLTVVAIGTGSPELVLSVQAALAGNSGIALGNVVGSNISNVALVLGVAALVRPMKVRSQLIRREMPLMIGVTVLVMLMLIDGTLGRIDGIVLVVGGVSYLVGTYLSAQRGDTEDAVGEFEQAVEGMCETADGATRRAWLDTLLLVMGLGALLAGASLLLKGAVFVAAEVGLSEVVIGLTVVALGTSLPELAASVAASRRGEADVAFGNVIGSNIFNILLVLGVSAMIHPFQATGLRPLDLTALLGSAILLLVLMWRGWQLSRAEGAILLAGYAAYLYSLLG